MNLLKPMSQEEFSANPFNMIGKDWMLITAEKDGKVNSMTASWGGLGVMWGKNVVYMVVRKSRFTKTLIDGTDTFSLSFFDHEKYAKMLGYMGKVSGRDEDKIKTAGVTVEHYEGTPYIAEASKVFVCKKMYCQPMTSESFIDKSLIDKWYKDDDYHDLYIGEIVEVLSK